MARLFAIAALLEATEGCVSPRIDVSVHANDTSLERRAQA